MLANRRDSLVALVLFAFEAIIVDVKLIVEGKRNFEDEVLITMDRKEKKSERRGIYIEGIKNSSVFCLTNGANFIDTCHHFRGKIETIL